MTIFEGARCTVCESCGNRLDVHERVKCIGCGAPLAPGERKVHHAGLGGESLGVMRCPVTRVPYQQ